MKGMKAFGRYGSLGFELLGSIAVGYYLGVWADKKLGTRWITFAGFLLGCYAGFRALYRASQTMTRDIEREERLARGEDPWAPPAKPDEDEDDDHDASEPADKADPPTVTAARGDAAAKADDAAKADHADNADRTGDQEKRDGNDAKR
jgi:hypothetical protein